MSFPYPAKKLFLAPSGQKFEIKVEHCEFTPLSPDQEEFVAREVERVKVYDLGFPAESRVLLTHSLEEKNGTLHLVAMPAARKYLQATTQPEFVEQFGELNVLRGISMLAVTITGDNRLILGVRTPKTRYPLQRHCAPAGRLAQNERDPYNGTLIEYKEELGLERSDLTEITCIGVAQDMVHGSFSNEFVFIGRTNLRAREVIEKAKHAASANEHPVLESLIWNPEYIRDDILLSEPDAWPPTGFAGVAMALEYLEGEEYRIDWDPTPMVYEKYMGRRGPMVGIK